MTERAPAIRAAGVTKTLGGQRVVDDVDLEVPAGRITVLMGPNGDGKTVLLCCLAGGLRPSTGVVTVHGRPVGSAAADLSLLLQDAVGLPALTGPETAEFYADLHPNSTGRWRDLLERLEMTDDETVLKHCSGGERRKVELAAALDPAVPVVLLDEPTAGLDLGALDGLHRLFRQRRDRGHTVVLTSHSPLDARLADHLVFVRDGGIAATGSLDTLLDDLPPVVRLRGAVHEAVGAVEPYLRAGHAYGSGVELRGFLGADRSMEAATATVADLAVTVDRDEPTVVDLYEFLAVIDRD